MRKYLSLLLFLPSLAFAQPSSGGSQVKITDGTDTAEVLNLASNDPLSVAIVDNTGAQISSFGGGTEYTTNAAAPTDPVGATFSMERDDQLSTLTEVEGDWTNPRGSSKGALWVTIPDVNGDPITSFGGGTQYAEGAGAATMTGTLSLMEIAGDVTAPIQGTVAGGLLVNLGANNDITGTVTCDAGTNLNTSALLTEGTFNSEDFATQTTLAAINAKLVTGTDIGDVTINNAAGASAVNIQDGNNSITVDDGSGAFNVTVDASALPTDAATATLQGTGNTSLSNIDTDTSNIDTSLNNVETFTTDIPNVIGTDGGVGPTKVVSIGGTTSGGNVEEVQVDADGQLQVDVVGNVTVNSHAVTNAGTFAVQVDGSALTALQNIDTDATTIIGHVDGIEGFLNTIDNPVQVLGTDLYTEASSSGMTLGAVRRDADTTLVNTTNEFGPLQMDANGRLKVEAFSGETLPVSLASGTVASGAIASGAIASGAVASGAYASGSIASGAIASGAIAAGAIAAGATSIAENEDEVHTTGDRGVKVWAVRDDTLNIRSGAENDYEPFHTDASGALYVNTSGRTTGGHSVYHLVSAATTNASSVKASAGLLHCWFIYNSNASMRKVAFHNTSGTPTAGASVYFTLNIPGASGANNCSEGGIEFSTGIGITTVTGLADSDATAVAANDLTINLFYE